VCGAAAAKEPMALPSLAPNLCDGTHREVRAFIFIATAGSRAARAQETAAVIL